MMVKQADNPPDKSGSYLAEIPGRGWWDVAYYDANAKKWTHEEKEYKGLKWGHITEKMGLKNNV